MTSKGVSKFIGLAQVNSPEDIVNFHNPWTIETMKIIESVGSIVANHLFIKSFLHLLEKGRVL